MLRFAAAVLIVVLCAAAGMFFLANGEKAARPVATYSYSGESVKNAPHVLVLNYHKVDETPISLSVSPADFAAQLRYLLENDFNVININQFYDGLTGQKELPKNAVLITFDDGYKDNYTNAFPILRQLNLPATIFVITDFVGQKNYVTWDDLREMAVGGISVESHTKTHNSLTDLTDEALKEELRASKERIKKELAKDADFLAYPTGAYNLHIAGLVKDAGYKAAFTVKYGNADGDSNLYAVERVPIFHTEDTMKSFRERISYTPLFSGNGWEKN